MLTLLRIWLVLTVTSGALLALLITTQSAFAAARRVLAELVGPAARRVEAISTSG